MGWYGFFSNTGLPFQILNRLCFSNIYKNYLKQPDIVTLQLLLFLKKDSKWHWLKWWAEGKNGFLRGKSWKVVRMLFGFWTKVSSLILILIEMTLELLGFKQSTLGETQIVCLSDGGSSQGVGTKVSTIVRWFTKESTFPEGEPRNST